MRQAWLILALACLTAAPARASEADEQKALEETKRFVATGGDVNDTLHDKDMLLGHAAMGVTRLHDAVDKGYASVARYLVEHGADPRAGAETKSHYNDVTPIEMARETGADRLAELMEAYHVHRMWYSPGDEEPTQVSLDADQVISSWSEPPLPKPDLLVRVKAHEVRAAPGAAVAPARGATYASLTGLPTGTSWTQQLAPADTQQGRVFLVKSRSGTLFKVLVAHVHREGSSLTLSFTDLVRTAGADQAVRDVVAEFQSALRDGRITAAANLCTKELGRTLRDTPEHRVRPSMRRVRSARAERDTASVVVFERRPTTTGSDDVLITFELSKIGPTWRIKSMRSAAAGTPPPDPPAGGELEDDEL